MPKITMITGVSGPDHSSHYSRPLLQKGHRANGAERRTAALRMSSTATRPDLVTMMVEAHGRRVCENRLLY